jgi:hypothetical protein
MQARLTIPRLRVSVIRILSREGERYEKAYINRYGRCSLTSLERK